MAEIAISAVTEGELNYGVARKPEAIRLREVVDEFLLRVTILPWDSDAAGEYGELRASLEQQGQPMGSLDLMIGAHALAAGLILVTNDRAFGRIAKIKIQDWTKS
jgi:tRNA(fMet)-specific endonuclease VapC